MTVKYNLFGPETRLEVFADEHKLVMSITEHPEYMGARRYFATFVGTGVPKECGIVMVYGEGDSPGEAMEDYSKRIAGKLIVKNAFSNIRREIQCPNEWVKE